jgi:hypothetical protein
MREWKINMADIVPTIDQTSSDHDYPNHYYIIKADDGDPFRNQYLLKNGVWGRTCMLYGVHGYYKTYQDAWNMLNTNSYTAAFILTGAL